MIVREKEIEISSINKETVLGVQDYKYSYADAIFFDLEHYVYKKPKCVGVFGACYYEESSSKLIVTQYMIENRDEIFDILVLAKKYFLRMNSEKKKEYIITFSGNNDFTVINYLFNKYGIEFKFDQYFKSIDIQREYEKQIKKGIGLKALEKQFEIVREGEVLSGSNIAKTFHKVIKDKEYIFRMPQEKIGKILQYNEQDVVNLFHIYVNWSKYIKIEEEDNNSTCIEN